MKVNVATPVTNMRGEDLKEGDKPITYRDIFYVALNAQAEGERPSAESSMKAYKIMSKLFSEDEVELDNAEAAFIEERVSKVYKPEIYGRVHDFLG